MIPARRRPWAVFIAERLVYLALRRQFRAFYLVNPTRLALLDPSRPVVGVANHSNWWDGFALLRLSGLLPDRRFYLAQEERHLARYRFLSLIGAFGLDPASPRSGLRESLRLLQAPQNVVWMFPEGVMRSALDPLAIKAGANLLARRSEAQLLPVVLRYEWFQESRPSIVANIGFPLAPSATPEELGNAMEASLHECDEQIARIDLSGFETLLTPVRSINRVWDRWRGAGHDPMNR